MNMLLERRVTIDQSSAPTNKHPRPRVLHLINNFEIGGTERQAVELLKRLDTDRYDVRLAAVRNLGPLYREIAARFPSVTEFPLTSFYDANAVRQVLRLRSLMVREQVDILHAHDFYAGMLGIPAAQYTRVRVIGSQRHLQLSDRRVHIWGQRLINRLAHRVLVNSEAIRRRILTTSGVSADKIVVINNGLNLLEQPPAPQATHDELCHELGLQPDVRFIGIVARLREEKGHRFFIDAARRVVLSTDNVHFVVVGDGPLRHEIQAQANRFGIGARVHFVGDRMDASRLYAGFDVSVLASLHEGFPNAVLEAMAAGVAVVATAVGGVTELIQDGSTGYLVAPANAEALAQRITFALGDEEGRAAIAARGREFVKRFSMGKMVKAVETLYDELYTTRQVREDTPLLRSGTRAGRTTPVMAAGHDIPSSTKEGSRLSLF
jgi:L-malate glycosyltransferase